VDVPEAARSRGAQVGPALRRLVVTPTFAAGLGVVVAAGLAVSMTARTVLHFTGPDQQKSCTLRGCAKGPGNPGGVGTLASAKPGIRLLPATSGPSGSSRPRSTSSGGPGSGHVAGSPEVIDYQTTQKWPGGFDGQIVISGIPASVRGTWRLAFDYPGTSIVEVQGAQWEPTGQDSGVAEAGTSSGSAALSGGASQNGTSSTGAGSKATSGATTSGATSGGASPSGASQNKPDVSDGTMSGSGEQSADHSSEQSADHSSQQSTVVITIEAAGPPSAPSGCRFNNAACSFR
jgi:Cellulose binding domain